MVDSDVRTLLDRGRTTDGIEEVAEGEETMNEMKVARGLGVFSIGLGLTEVVAGEALGRWLGMEDKTWLIRAFGVREVATGVGVLADHRPRAGVWARVAGDVMDLAALGSAYHEDNPNRRNVAVAIAAVAGITMLDYWCAKRLQSGRPHGSMRRHRENVAEGPTHRLKSGSFPSRH